MFLQVCLDHIHSMRHVVGYLNSFKCAASVIQFLKLVYINGNSKIDRERDVKPNNLNDFLKSISI